MLKTTAKCVAFKYFLWEQESIFCNVTCHHEASECPIVDAIKQSDFAVADFCPVCGSYQIDVKVIKQESKSELDGKSEKTKLIPVYTGSYLFGIRVAEKMEPFAGMPYRILYACPKCVVGKIWKVEPFDLEGDPGCHHKLWMGFQERMVSLTKKYQEVSNVFKTT